MLRYLIPILLSSQTAALQPRDFRVPPIDFTQLSGIPTNAYNLELLAQLQKNGIIALQNVPDFAKLRQEYLRTAATCAVQVQKQGGAAFLLHRELRDRTNRYTVSLESGRRLVQSLDQSADLLAHCPDYAAVHAAFSLVVEQAVANVGTALDATQKFHIAADRGGVMMTARKLLEESVHLDHFHAYEGAQVLDQVADASHLELTDLSLELHTDNGVMIAMSAPEYFEVTETDTLHVLETRGNEVGLVIQTAHGEIVRPVLYPNELILMLGSGIEEWVHTSPPLRSVLHGMQYPHSVTFLKEDARSKVLRAWFGKMLLLESEHVMANSGLTFGQYANQTTRYLVQQGTEEAQRFGTVACPPHRRLVASANTCAPQICSLKSTASSSDLTSSCQITCNHAAASDVALCQQYCDCHASTSSGTTCWMLCVENLAPDVCPGEQKCNSPSRKEDLAMTCVGGTTAPSTPPTSPSTAPTSGPSPSTASQNPTTSSSSPATEAPAISAPGLTVPDETTESGTIQTRTPQSGTAESSITESGTPESSPTEFGTIESSTTDLESTESSSTDLDSTDLNTTDLGSTELNTTQSGTVQLNTTESEAASPEPETTLTPATKGSKPISSASNAGLGDSTTNVGDEATQDTAETSAPTSTSPSSASGSSSGASVVRVANLLNAVAVVVATYVCIQ